LLSGPGEQVSDYENLNAAGSSISTPTAGKLNQSPMTNGQFHAGALEREERTHKVEESEGPVGNHHVEVSESTEYQPSGAFPTPTSRPLQTQLQQPPSAQSTVAFNGPVFFGYSPEQAVTLIQQLGSCGIMK
jgi:hypothetical protein